jgi:HEAT repeat protein
MTRSLAAFLLLAAPAVAQSFEEVVARVARYQVGDDQKILARYGEMLGRDSASPEKTRAMEQALLSALEAPATTVMGQDQLCRGLMLVGSAAAVPAVVKLLASPETADMARYALERIPGAAVGQALRDMLPKTSGIVKVGVVNTLGRRRDAASVAAIRPLLQDSDLQVAASAAAALGRIGDAASASALASARAKASGKLRAEIDEAYLMCAEEALRRKDSASALAIYKEMSGASEAEPVRIAALRGTGIAGGRGAIPMLAAAMKSGEPRIAAQAIRSLAAIPGPESLAALTQPGVALPPLAKVQVVAALADRGDRAALPFLAAASKDASQGVRSAALLAMGRLGDASTVLPLAEAAAHYAAAGQSAGEAASRTGGFPNERQIGPAGELTELAAAREALARLAGPGVDQAILSGVGSAAPRARVELISAASERGIRSATPALLKSAADADREVRRASIRALRNTVAPGDVPALLAMLAQAAPADRLELARVVSSALKRSDAVSVQPVMSAYESAADTDHRGALLSVLAQVGRDESLPVLRGALKDSNPEIRRGAIRALGDWPTSAPMDDLRDIARNDPNPAFQVLALQGYIRLIGLPENRPPAATVSLLAEAMRLARRAEEKRTLLAALQALPTAESLAVVEAASKDPSVAAEAAAAAERIRQRMAPRRRPQ